MIENLLIFAFSLVLVVKGATLATKYSAKLAEHFSISRYVIGFVIVAFISILPETIISINSAIQGIPEFGLGTLFGSNIADLSLIFALLILFSGRGVKIESKVLKDVSLYPFFLLLPIILGLNGHFSRIDGTILIITGVLFYYLVFKNGSESSKVFRNGNGKYKSIFLLFFAMSLLLIGAHFTVTSATMLAERLNITPILIGIIIVSLGTTMPEFLYSLKAIKQKEDSLAIGDILGSVLADATIVVGILAFISPFYFPVKIAYITGAFMVVASLVLLKFMRSGRTISKKEGILLLIFWVTYAAIEFFVNN
jgi:cation:H+ antiporter